MSQTSAVIIFVIVVMVVVVGMVRARKMSKEQSALTMHPDNFKKPDIEQVEIKRSPDDQEERSAGS